MKKVDTGAIATTTPASNKTGKKVMEPKQGNGGQQSVLTDTKDKIVLRDAVGVQDTVNSNKETTGAVWEAQEIKGRPKGADYLRADIEKKDKEYREIMAEISRSTSKSQEKPRAASDESEHKKYLKEKGERLKRDQEAIFQRSGTSPQRVS